MLRRFVVPALAAVALAGIMLFPSSAMANGRPNFLLCGYEDGERSWVNAIHIDWDHDGMRWAVADCLDNGGHPVGVSEDGKEGGGEEAPAEEKPVTEVLKTA